MVALTTLGAPVRPEEDVDRRPLPWRRMAWVIWRQHRSALIGVAMLLVALAVLLLVEGLQLHHAFTAATTCRPASSAVCGALASTFNGTAGFLANGIVLQAVPALIGAFVGAPVLAREFENGTIRYAWTQGFGRLRWTFAKLAALGVVLAGAAGAMSVLLTWYYQPYFARGDGNPSLSSATPFAPGLFDLRGVALAFWTLVAFAIGVLAGTLIRRVVPAIVATLVVYGGLAVVAAGWMRQRYVSPLRTSSGNVPRSAWIVEQRWTTRGGRPVSQSVIDEVLSKGPAPVVGKGGFPKSFDTIQYLFSHGYTQVTSYQPASRFWAFQWIEAGWLFALSVLLIAVTVWLVRRRAV